MKFRTAAVLVLVVLMVTAFTGCVSSSRVTIDSNVKGADVFVDGRNVGQTPVYLTMSNAIWDDPDILVKKDGYNERRTSVQREIKAPNLILGLLIWWPSLLWVSGPKEYQYIQLSPVGQ